MNAFQVKTLLWKKGLTISDIARSLELEYEATFDSLRTMLTNLFYHGQYNPKLAALVEEKYGIKIERPRSRQTVREAVKQAA
ncbi:MAG: hypothetical protein ABI539_08380 [Acidobacteriota bacterium]